MRPDGLRSGPRRVNEQNNGLSISHRCIDYAAPLCGGSSSKKCKKVSLKTWNKNEVRGLSILGVCALRRAVLRQIATGRVYVVTENLSHFSAWFFRIFDKVVT